MKKGKWRRMTGLLSCLILCIVFLAGCKTKSYEEIDIPTLETAEANLKPEETTREARTKEDLPDAQSSALNPDVTKETQIQTEYKEVEETVYVNASLVNIRKSGSTDSEVAGQVKLGDSLKRTGYSEAWSRVVFKDQVCYVSSQFLTKEPPETKAVADNGSGRLIAIDAGHQGKGNSEKEPIGPGSSTMKAKVASGATGVSTGLPEYKLTLAVSQKLKAELELRGYQTVMIRESHDVNISNAERAETANKSGADIFIRVHANSLDNQSVTGALTMCQTSKNPYNGSLYSKSSSLSKKITDGICAATGFKNKGVQETDSMSGINWCKIPVSIVEMGFMSNAEEDKKMATEEYQQKIAKGIADGIDAYYGAGE